MAGQQLVEDDEFTEDDEVDVGTCWCGAYGTAGTVHVRKPSPNEPPEECGTFA